MLRSHTMLSSMLHFTKVQSIDSRLQIGSKEKLGHQFPVCRKSIALLAYCSIASNACTRASVVCTATNLWSGTKSKTNCKRGFRKCSPLTHKLNKILSEFAYTAICTEPMKSINYMCGLRATASLIKCM